MYTDKLLRHCFGRVVNIEDRLDIVQDVFFELVKVCREFESELHMSNWLYSVANNKISDFLRKKYRAMRMEVALDFDIETVTTLDDEFAEMQELIDNISKLPLNQEIAIRLYYIDGYSTDEIANFLKIKQSSVWSLISKARESLRKLF